jgi:gluconate 5-dehydrogenase
MNTLEQFKLEGRTAIVTGGGRGLGYAMAQGLAEAGAAVVITGRDAPTLKKAAARLKKAGGPVLAAAGDITREKDLDRLIRTALKISGRIDILVNNAGITSRHPAADFPLEAWDRIMDVNVRSMFRLTQMAGRQMVKQNYGKIINVGSIFCHSARPTIPAYIASKGAVKQLTSALAVEWAKYHITVNTIAPGYMRTELTATLQKDAKFHAWVMGHSAIQRWGEPEDLKGAAVFLASAASDFVTGQTLYVDGGFTIS